MTKAEEKFHDACLIGGAVAGTVLGAAFLELGESHVPAWKNMVSGGSMGGPAGLIAGGLFAHGVRYSRLGYQFLKACRGDRTSEKKPDNTPEP
jgi:high-affinity Fe2+/Pb2+ permease